MNERWKRITFRRFSGRSSGASAPTASSSARRSWSSKPTIVTRGISNFTIWRSSITVTGTSVQSGRAAVGTTASRRLRPTRRHRRPRFPRHLPYERLDPRRQPMALPLHRYQPKAQWAARRRRAGDHLRSRTRRRCRRRNVRHRRRKPIESGGLRMSAHSVCSDWSFVWQRMNRASEPPGA